MKKIIASFALVVLVSFFSACTTEYKILDSVESISLVVDKSSKIVGETMEFTVNTNNGTNVSDEVIIYINGEAIDGTEFSSDEIGDYTVYADYFGVKSANVNVRFHDGSEINYVKRVLIEDYTGTWCGNCPRVSHALELVTAQSSLVVPVAIHRSSSNPADPNYDPFNFDSSELDAIVNISGYPRALLNRMTRWQPLEQNNIPQVINLTQGENPKLGLAMDVEVVNNNINLDLKIQFSKDFNNLRYVVYVLENGLIYDQVNYTNFYTGPGYISNFEHNHVLRACLTPLLGEPFSNTSTGQTFSKTFSVPMPSNISDPSKIEFIAFVVDENHRAINVRKANIGENQDFEEQ
jgi:hypothetical protein